MTFGVNHSKANGVTKVVDVRHLLGFVEGLDDCVEGVQSWIQHARIVISQQTSLFECSNGSCDGGKKSGQQTIEVASQGITGENRKCLGVHRWGNQM